MEGGVGPKSKRAIRKEGSAHAEGVCPADVQSVQSLQGGPAGLQVDDRGVSRVGAVVREMTSPFAMRRVASGG